jgi:hypothetical protein
MLWLMIIGALILFYLLARIYERLCIIGTQLYDLAQDLKYRFPAALDDVQDGEAFLIRKGLR